MSDALPPTPAEKAEAATIRRRWVSLAEIVGVAGVAIAAASLWLSWSDHRSAQADKQQAVTTEAREQSRYTVRATVARNGDIVLQRDDRHPLGDVAVVFPDPLGIAPQTSPVQTIAHQWYARALLAATDGGPDRQTGKLPVLLTVQYWHDDAPKTVSGLYDIVWQTKGRMLLGRDLKIVALRLRSPATSKAALAAAWAAEAPKR